MSDIRSDRLHKTGSSNTINRIVLEKISCNIISKRVTNHLVASRQIRKEYEQGKSVERNSEI